MNTYKFFTTNNPFTKRAERGKERDQRQKTETKFIASLIRT